jgi:hypothetical protein
VGGDAAVPGAAGPCDQSRADRLGAVGPPRHRSVGSRIWVAEQSRQRARRGVTVTVSAPTPRTVRVRPVPNGRSIPSHRGHGMSPASRSARPARGSPRRSLRTSPFMTASIAYHTPCRQRSVGVAPGQLSPCAVTNLPTRPAPFRPADDHRPNQAVDQCSRLRRRGDDADEPSNGTRVVRSVSDGDPSVHGHPRWGSTVGPHCRCLEVGICP